MGIEAHRIGCPVGTDGAPMGTMPGGNRPHRAPIGVSHETKAADSSSATNQNPNMHIMPQEPFGRE